MPLSRTLTLLKHSAAACPPGLAIDVRVSPGGAGLTLAYRLQGPLADILVPAPCSPGFADGLWQHTCFEAFVAAAGNPGYREFNFSPSGQWAAYAFTDYRQRDPDFAPGPTPEISVRRDADSLQLDVCVSAGLLPAAAPGTAWELGLSAVVEAADGSRSYWALAHPGLQPDFHRRDAFRLALAAPNLKA